MLEFSAFGACLARARFLVALFSVAHFGFHRRLCFIVRLCLDIPLWFLGCWAAEKESMVGCIRNWVKAERFGSVLFLFFPIDMLSPAVGFCFSPILYFLADFCMRLWLDALILFAIVFAPISLLCLDALCLYSSRFSFFVLKLYVL